MAHGEPLQRKRVLKWSNFSMAMDELIELSWIIISDHPFEVLDVIPEVIFLLGYHHVQFYPIYLKYASVYCSTYIKPNRKCIIL